MKRGLTIASGILFFLLISSLSFAQQPAKKGEKEMIVGQNKQLILRLFGEVFNQKSFSVIDELYNPNVVDHSAFEDQAPGIEGIKSAIKGFFEIFDSVEITVEDVIAEGEKVVTREAWRGAIKPSGKIAEGSIIHIFRIQDGKITDEWSRGWDWLENL